MPISELFHYRLTPCCNPEQSFLMFWNDDNPFLQEGVYLYVSIDTENLKFNECYVVEIIQGSISGSLETLIESNFEFKAKDCEEAFETEACFCTDSVKVVNCFDETLGFDFVPEEGTELNLDDIISLDLIAGDPIILGDENLCVDSFGIIHPQINPGAINPTFFSGTAVKQLNLYNGKPYYLFALTEDDHGVPGLALTYYFIWNSALSRWEVWPNFNIFTGPSNSECNNLPFMALVPGTFAPPETNCSDPITTGGQDCIYTSIGNTTECDTYVTGIREVTFCEEEVTIDDFINCWRVIAFTATKPTHPTLAITEEHNDCEECLEAKNEPPCIKATDCLTGSVIYLSTAETFLDYVGKIIQVELGNLIICYSIELSDICPEEPAALAGTIVDCFSKCEDCLPKCRCTRAINGASVAKRLRYIDCNNQEQETSEIVGSGKTSLKYCVLSWIDEDVTEIIEFGNCVDNECPEIPRPKRVVTPGYNTPICTPEHYERIVCRYAENKYREVMEERFGIANCCPDESLPNDIKYELIHLQMLLDPDYECMSDPNPCDCHGTGSLSVREINCNS